MLSTEDRMRRIVANKFELDLRFDCRIADSGISSMDAVAFYKAVNDEFNLNLEPGRLPPPQVAAYIDRPPAAQIAAARPPLAKLQTKLDW